MKQLGIGVRVWIGWCSDIQVGAIVDGRLQTGTICAGPFLPGDMVRDVYTGKMLVVSGERSWWSVQLDIGGMVSADECLLTPIDDDDGVEVPREEHEKQQA